MWLIGDYGFEFLSHLYKNMSLRTMQLILKEFGGVMTCTRSAADPPELLQMGEDGRFVVVTATDEMINAHVKMLNSSAVMTCCRHGIE